MTNYYYYYCVLRADISEEGKNLLLYFDNKCNVICKSHIHPNLIEFCRYENLNDMINSPHQILAMIPIKSILYIGVKCDDKRTKH